MRGFSRRPLGARPASVHRACRRAASRVTHSQAEKDQLNFGLMASRELDVYPVASDLYALAGFVTWWGKPQR